MATTDEEPYVRYLSVEEALCVLPEGEEFIHTLRNPSMGMMVGADWGRPELVEAIRTAEVRMIGGEQCRAMEHGLVIDCDGEWLFVAAQEARLAELDQGWR